MESRRSAGRKRHCFMTGRPDTDALRQGLFDRLDALGIETTVLPYPEHETVEEGKMLRGDMEGTFTKNLLLKDKKGQLFLLAAHEDREVDLKRLHRRLGANGRLGFVQPERMISTLGVGPGALTPLARLAQSADEVRVVIDAGLMAEDQLNFHPLVSTESVGLSPGDLVRFLKSCGCEPLIVELANETAGSGDCTRQATLS